LAGRLSECQRKDSLGRFLALKKYQLALNYLTFPIAFQADDEGSIPFTRSNVFNRLVHFALGVILVGLLGQGATFAIPPAAIFISS
jgi:hypothetical protein